MDSNLEELNNRERDTKEVGEKLNTLLKLLEEAYIVTYGKAHEHPVHMLRGVVGREWGDYNIFIYSVKDGVVDFDLIKRVSFSDFENEIIFGTGMIKPLGLINLGPPYNYRQNFNDWFISDFYLSIKLSRLPVLINKLCYNITKFFKRKLLNSRSGYIPWRRRRCM